MGEGGLSGVHDGGTLLEQAGPSGADELHQYRNLTVESEPDRGVLALWETGWLGRILMWRVPGGVIYIGPHWYCSLIMLSFILGVGGYYTSSVVEAGPLHLLGGLGVTILSTVSFLRCALANPGVLKARQRGDLREQAEGRRCEKCNVAQPRGCSHCEFCQVCIEGFDHHCPWMGKCIGRQNLCAFYNFICISFSSLGYIFVCTVLASATVTSSRGRVPVALRSVT